MCVDNCLSVPTPSVTENICCIVFALLLKYLGRIFMHIHEHSILLPWSMSPLFTIPYHPIYCCKGVKFKAKWSEFSNILLFQICLECTLSFGFYVIFNISLSQTIKILGFLYRVVINLSYSLGLTLVSLNVPIYKNNVLQFIRILSIAFINIL